VPGEYLVQSELKEGADLALAFLDAGIVQESDGDGRDPSALIAAALRRTLGDGLKRDNLELVFRLGRLGEQEQGGCYCLWVLIERVAIIAFDRATAVLDVVDPRLGPSLLTHILKHTPLVPAFTPALAVDFVRTYHWHGEDDDSELMDMARNDLAYERRCEPERIPEEDVVEVAHNYGITRAMVDERLDARYQESGTLSLGGCRRLCERHSLRQALIVIEALERLRHLGDEIHELNPDLLEEDDNDPFGLLFTLGEGYDLTREVYGEYEDSTWNAGVGFRPSFALAFSPDDAGSLDYLKATLHVCGEVLRQLEVLLSALEEV
jgi:hypothetical protein